MIFIGSIKLVKKQSKNKKALENQGLLRWCLQESNQGHMDFQSIALPTELRHQLLLAGANIYSILIYTNKNVKKGRSFFTFF